MMYSVRRCLSARARALAAVALWSALLSVGTANGAVNVSVDMPPDSVHDTPAGDARPIDRGLSQTRDSAKVRKHLAVVNAATTANAAAQPIPQPTEYMVLAGGLLILWGGLRWKNRARPIFNAPRSRLKR